MFTLLMRFITLTDNEKKALHMITYTCYNDSSIQSSYIIDFSHENDDKHLNYMKVLIKNETKECCYGIKYLNYTGLSLKFIANDDCLIVGVDFGAAIIGNDLSRINDIKSNFLFYDAIFLREQILIIFECELYIYNIANNFVKLQIPLKDMINDYYIEKDYFLYNTTESSFYNRVCIDY